LTENITLTDHSSSHISIRGKSVWLFVVPASALVCLFALPLFALLWRAVEAGLMGQMLEPTALSALRLSLLTSTLATLAAALTGTPLAFALARWPFRGRAWLELLIDLPVVLPPAVAGLALLMAFGRRGVFGGALSAALAAMAAPNPSLACQAMQDFINLAKAQQGRKITAAQADYMIAQGSDIKLLMGCPTATAWTYRPQAPRRPVLRTL